MKFSGRDFDELLFTVAPLDSYGRRLLYKAGDFPRSEAVKDLWMRYRWDILWESGYHPDYSRYNDSHIDTALRKAIPDDDYGVVLSRVLSVDLTI